MRNTSRWVAAGLAMAMVVAACSPAADVTPSPGSPTAAPGAATPPPAAGPSGTLTITRFSELDPVWHPVAHGTGQQSVIFAAIFDTLVKTAPDSRTIVPGLATSWEISPDARVFTFNLAQNATWHDGQPVTANDVVFTATWSAQNAALARGWLPTWPLIEGAEAIKGTTNPLSGIRAIDDHTVEVTLAQPNAEFLRAITNASNSIVPQHLLKDATEADVESLPFSTRAPIGSGPYTFVRYETGQYVELDAYTDYHGGSPKIAKIFVKLLEPEAVLAQLESGDLDIATRVSPLEAARLAQNPNLQVLPAQDPGSDRLFLNMDPGARLADKLVRQAMYFAIDRAAILANVLDGRGRILVSPPGFKDYPDLEQYAYDPERARQLLAESGFDTSQPIRITYNQGVATYPTVMPIIQQYLEDVGMKVELMPLDATAWVALITDPERRGEWDAFTAFGGAEFLSPSETAIYFSCEAPSSGAKTGYENCDMMDLWSKARSTSDEAERDQAYHQIARYLNEDVPMLYLWQGELAIVANTRVQGFTPHVVDRESLISILDVSIAP